MNEELRSTLEELETSKEELQSINEELVTVNQENRHKVDELSQLSSDLQNLMSATQIATLFLDRELRILRFTPPVADLFNIRTSDQGRPLADLTHRLNYDQITADAQAALRDLVPIEREVSSDEGSWYLTRLLPYRSQDDRIDGVVITFVDVTDLKRAEEALRRSVERFRALVDASAQTVWSADEQGAVNEDSPPWRSLTGQSLDEWLGWGWLTGVHEDDRERVEREWLEAVRSKRPYETELRLRHEGSGWRWISLRAVPLADPDGSVRGWVGMNVDVHERRQAEDEVRKLNSELENLVVRRTEQLRQANRELESFNYSVSHDLRAPLRTIAGFTTALKEEYAGALDETGRSYLERVEAGTIRMRELIDNLLLLARVGGGELDRREVDLAKLGATIAAELREREPGRSVEFEFSGDLTVHGDPRLLRVALEKLLENAWKFTRDTDAPRIEVGKAERNGNKVVYVRDNGAGFDSRQAEKLFVPFGRLHSDDSFPGTGIGLAIVQRIIHLHGSVVSGEGEVGEGACFYFTLPEAESTP